MTSTNTMGVSQRIQVGGEVQPAKRATVFSPGSAEWRSHDALPGYTFLDIPAAERQSVD